MNEFENDDVDEQEYLTSITVETPYRTCSIVSIDNVENIFEFKEMILKPILLAMSYSPQLVDEVFGDVEEEIVPNPITFKFDWSQCEQIDIPEFEQNLVEQIVTAREDSPYKVGDCFSETAQESFSLVDEDEVFVISVYPNIMGEYTGYVYAVSIKNGNFYLEPYKVENIEDISQEEMDHILPTVRFKRLTT